jgi:hypothetical protein
MSLWCINDSLKVLCCLRISGTPCHALKIFDAIVQCVHHLVGVGDCGIGDALVLELHCVGKSFALGVLNVAVMCAIIFWVK